MHTQQIEIDSKTLDVSILNIGVAIDFFVCVFLWKNKKELWVVRDRRAISLLLMDLGVFFLHLFMWLWLLSFLDHWPLFGSFPNISQTGGRLSFMDQLDVHIQTLEVSSLPVSEIAKEVVFLFVSCFL